MRLTNCRFYNHIDGRYVQFFGNAEGEPADPAFAIYENCYFGKMKVENVATHTSQRVRTIYDNCIFDTDYLSVEVKGDVVFTGACEFRGGKEGSGQSIVVVKGGASVVVGSGVHFSGNVEAHILAGEVAIELDLRGPRFSGLAGYGVMTIGSTGHIIRSRGTVWKGLEAANTYIYIFSGTAALVDAEGDDFGGGGNNGIWVKVGATVTLLRTRDNYFHGLEPIKKEGTVTTETAKDNTGYADV
jgi:hypothetical protein